MSNSYKVLKKSWMDPLKIRILFAWSWSTNIIYLEVNNKIFVRPSWFLLYTFEMPVTESPTAVAVQDYTQVDDPRLNYFIFNIIILTKLYNCTWFNFILEFCSFMLHFILHVFSVFVVVVVVVLLEKVSLINFYSQKWYTWWWNNSEMKELGTIYICYNSFPWISLIKLWNHLANNPVYLVHSRAGLQSKT